MPLLMTTLQGGLYIPEADGHLGGVPVRLQDQPQVAGVQARAGPPSLLGALNTST